MPCVVFVVDKYWLVALICKKHCELLFCCLEDICFSCFFVEQNIVFDCCCKRQVLYLFTVVSNSGFGCFLLLKTMVVVVYVVAKNSDVGCLLL